MNIHEYMSWTKTFRKNADSSALTLPSIIDLKLKCIAVLRTLTDIFIISLTFSTKFFFKEIYPEDDWFW
jgi:hypothetical protein